MLQKKKTSSRIYFWRDVCGRDKTYVASYSLDSSLAALQPAYERRLSHVYFGWQKQSAPVSADGSIYTSLLYPNNIILAGIHIL